MKIAIIGTGEIAHTHAQAVQQLGHDLIAVQNLDLSLAEKFALKWKTQAVDSLERVLDMPVDVVHVCTPPGTHYSICNKILQAGKHLICEKPLALNAEDARELYELSSAQEVVAATNFNVRFNDACQKARQMIRSGQIGPIQLIYGRYLQEFHILPSDYMWRYMPEIGGRMRAVTEIGSHWIDLVRFWTGLEIQAVSATFLNCNPQRHLKDGIMYQLESDVEGALIQVDSEDAAFLTLRFSNGALGSLVLSEVSHGRSNLIEIEVVGESKSLWWNTEDPYKLNRSEGKFKGVQVQINPFAGGFPDSYSSFFKSVYQAIEGDGGRDYPDFYDGYVNAAVCDAIYESAMKQSAWVEVRL